MNQRTAQAIAADQQEGVPLTRLIGDLDPWLVGSFVTLVCLGLIMVTSASVALRSDPLYFLWRQLLALGLGMLFGTLVLQQPLWRLRKVSTWLVFPALFMLLLVLIPGLGRESHGSSRWLQFGPFSFQASEPAKLCLIIYLAGYFVRHADQVRSHLLGLVKPVLMFVAVGLLLMLEPDFGATVVLFGTTMGLLFLAGVSLVRFFGLCLLGVGAMAGVLMAATYRIDRVTFFLNPWADAKNKGYQLAQSLIAFGRGDWSGVGLGGSVQKLSYLPEPHTDFIFAVMAEEFGLIGTVGVIALYGYVLWKSFAIAAQAQRAGQLFAAYLAYGIGLLISLQAFIHFGVNMGVLPTKGLTLPLVSYGNNSLIVCCIAVALLLRVEYESRAERPIQGATHAT